MKTILIHNFAEVCLLNIKNMKERKRTDDSKIMINLSPWFKNFLLNLGLKEILPGTKALLLGNEYQIISGNMPKDCLLLCHPFESPITKARGGDHSLLQAEVAWAMPPAITTSIRAGTSLGWERNKANTYKSRARFTG